MDKKERKVVYEDEGSRLSWDGETKCVELDGKKYTSGPHYRAALERTLNLLKDRKATKLLVDASKMGNISAEDLVWTETTWSSALLISLQGFHSPPLAA